MEIKFLGMKRKNEFEPIIFQDFETQENKTLNTKLFSFTSPESEFHNLTQTARRKE